MKLEVKHLPFLNSPLVAGHSDKIHEPEMDKIFSTKSRKKSSNLLVRFEVLTAVTFMIIALQNLIYCCLVDR